MDETTIEIGGNSALLWYGRLLGRISKYYNNRSEKLIKKGKKTVISNPSSKLVSGWTLITNFTIDGNKKYQLVTEGRYIEKYKECSENETLDSPLSNKEMFVLIKTHQPDWFLKE